MIHATAIPMLSDNYAWLLRCDGSGVVAIVDPAEFAPAEAAIEAAGGRLDLILITHHHDDHIAGVDAMRERYGAKVVGNGADAARLPRLDQVTAPGETVMVGDCAAAVIDTPGHTVGHIVFHFRDGDVLIAGDTLFSLGCGRLMEGTPTQMYASLRKLSVLPPLTQVCCGHEYTATNARFSLEVDPDNADLRAYAAHVTELRARGEPTIPSRLGTELACNPFLRAPDEASFAAVRRRRDTFK